MGENNSKWNNWQRINFQNIQAAHTTQCQRTKKPNQKVGKRPEQTFLQRRHQFSSVQSLSRVWLFATPWTAACQASLSITNSRSPPKLMSIESMMPSNRLILCHPLLLLPSVFPRIRVFWHSLWHSIACVYSLALYRIMHVHWKRLQSNLIKLLLFLSSLKC